MALTILIIDDDERYAESLLSHARDRGLEVLTARSAPAARAVLSGGQVHAVLLGDAREAANGWPLLIELRAVYPQLPVIVSASARDDRDRMEAARLGARGFIDRSAPAAAVIEQVRATLATGVSEVATVLMVDDDPLMHALVRALLERDGFRVVTLGDPHRLWETLEQLSPDLLMLDFEMPEVTGVDLCRMVRNDAQWASLPVLFLTGRAEASTVVDVFAAGADDYVSKPVVGPELLARVRNRIERGRLQRWAADVDELTGIANRRRANHDLERMFRMAARYEQPLTVGVLDLDGFRAINARHGHPGGDAVLRRLGAILATRFRGEDVVARWGGEEFLIALYGAGGDIGLRRITDLLDAFRGESFTGTDGQPFQVTFSAGVAEFPRSGWDFTQVFRAADDALTAAKVGGRNRVMTDRQ